MGCVCVRVCARMCLCESVRVRVCVVVDACESSSLIDVCVCASVHARVRECGCR